MKTSEEITAAATERIETADRKRNWKRWAWFGIAAAVILVAAAAVYEWRVSYTAKVMGGPELPDISKPTAK